MSETLAEKEKQRIRVELMTEIAKNEQNLEQYNEEFCRYVREYNIRDLEQLCTITECPLTSHELKEFGIFPKKKNLFNRLWTHVKDIVTKPHKSEEEAACTVRERAEIEDVMNTLEEQSRRSEEARIERDIIVEEQTERQREEEERQIREKAANLEKAKEELDERRNRKEKEIIEREEEERQLIILSGLFPFTDLSDDQFEKLAEKIERQKRKTFPFLALPYKLKAQIYRYIDLEGRRALRINEELAEIELKTEYQYERLKIERKEDFVELSNWIRSEEKWKMCYKVFIPMSEIEKELEIMGKNTQFDRITYTAKSDDRQIINGMKSLKVKEIIVHFDSNLNDADLRSIVENKEELNIYSGSSVTVNGLMWIYENMRDRHKGLKRARIRINETERCKFLDNFGNFNRESLTFTGFNHNLEVRHDDKNVIIVQDKLEITVSKKDERDKIGLIWFRIDC